MCDGLKSVDRVQSEKDTGVFDDDISCSLVKHHLIEDVDNLTHKLIILLLGYVQQTEERSSGGVTSLSSFPKGLINIDGSICS